MAVYHAAYLRELRVLYVEEVCPGRAEDGRVEGKRKCLLTENVVDSRSGGKYMREGTGDSEKVVSSSESDVDLCSRYQERREIQVFASTLSSSQALLMREW